MRILLVKLVQFCQNTHILHKTTHLTPWGAYVWMYPLGIGIYFEELLISFNFNMTLFSLFQISRVKLAHFIVKIPIFCQKRHIWPPGVLMYALTPWGNAINFEELLIFFNFGMNYVMIVQDWGGKLAIFVKYVYFCLKMDFWPPVEPSTCGTPV